MNGLRDMSRQVLRKLENYEISHCFSVYFSHKIYFEPLTNKNSIVYDTFFHAESESSSGFQLSRLDFAGLPDSIVPPGNPRNARLTISRIPFIRFQKLFLQNLRFLISFAAYGI